jgi:flagellar biosynthesis/type III secretory pathway protein FliH
MDSDLLADLLVDPPFQEAIGVLQMISKNPEDLQFYEARLKFLRDQQAQIEAAKQEGREEGLEEGHEKGIIAGKIQLLQELLGDGVSEKAELLVQGLPDLESHMSELQQRLRGRGI